MGGVARPFVQYQGSWAIEDDKNLLVGVSDSEGRNSSITIDFEGVYIAVAGTLSTNLKSPNPTKTLYYSLDGREDSSSQYNIWNPSSSLIYASPELSQGQHTLELILNSGGELQIHNVSFVTVDSQSHRTIQTVQGSRLLNPPGHAAALIGGVFGGVFLFAVLLFVVFLYRRRMEGGQGDGSVQVHMPTSKEAFTSGNNGLHGLSFTRGRKIALNPHLSALPFMNSKNEHDSECSFIDFKGQT
ncbi:hypothetical protein VNI00_002829 [Paramarasmius palmivorus]|uniref:Uncharacterized protein n=1 Tax=Paramarasmius palmivorus TaxID=297713 RepID=A0AAW0DZI1_9AGAR